MLPAFRMHQEKGRCSISVTEGPFNPPGTTAGCYTMVTIVNRKRNVRSQQFSIYTECQWCGNEQSPLQFGFLASGSCISHPDALGTAQGHNSHVKE